MRASLDTNILAYAEGIGDDAKQRASKALIQAAPSSSFVIPMQCLGELFRVMTGKARRDVASARTVIMRWATAYETVGSSRAAFHSAVDMATNHSVQSWDALILAVAAEQQCQLLISEDMQHGFTWCGVTIVNPFLEPKHPLLQALLMGKNG